MIAALVFLPIGVTLGALAVLHVQRGERAYERGEVAKLKAALEKQRTVNAQLNAECAHLAENNGALARQLTGWSANARKASRWLA